ncbi:restriction endonuclease subunit S [Romboutsia sp. MSSM.1001216sp_RTP31141st1_G3_RTP31141_220114]|uniref:restriction endonuclease subunit S n=1 Tax=unclassified Romboutsia TaxID=2626894 RepID=UPI0031B5AEF5
MKEGYKKTEVGVIPEDWEVVKLSDCTEKITDGSHSSPVPVEGSNYKICTVANMKGNSLDLSSSANISEEDFEKLTKNGCGPEYGDVLLSKDGTIGKTILFEQSNENVVLLSSIAILRPSSIKLNGKYLNQYLRDSRTLTRMTNTKTGSAIKRIVLRDIKDLKIVLPCLKEQEKIAEILSTVDCQIDDTEKLIEKCRVLKKGLMQRLLTKGIGHTEFKKTEVGEIPVGWEVKKLEEICSVKGGKRLPKGYQLLDEKTDNPYIRVADMYEGGVKLDDIKYVPSEVADKIKSYKIAKEDLFISVAGTLGIVGMVPEELDGANLTENADKLCDIKINKEFLMRVLQSKSIQNIIESEKTTSAQPKLALTRIREFSIPIPSDEEQERIADILTSVDNEIVEYENKKQRLQELKKGLMQQLLTGKIRTI